MLLEPECPDELISPQPAPDGVPGWDEIVDLLHASAFAAVADGRNSHDHYAWARMIAELVSLKD
jgi:hypothetical protein